jgi:hypothetical protein
MEGRKTFLLRIDGRTFDLLRRWADDEMRSVNGQIEFLLRDALRKAGRLTESAASGFTGSPEQDPEGR